VSLERANPGLFFRLVPAHESCSRANCVKSINLQINNGLFVHFLVFDNEYVITMYVPVCYHEAEEQRLGYKYIFLFICKH
jgi:hypothetical protein